MVAAARLVASPILHASVIGHERAFHVRAAYTHIPMLQKGSRWDTSGCMLLLEKERQGEKTGNHPDWSLSSRQILILPVCSAHNTWSNGERLACFFIFFFLFPSCVSVFRRHGLHAKPKQRPQKHNKDTDSERKQIHASKRTQ